MFHQIEPSFEVFAVEQVRPNVQEQVVGPSSTVVEKSSKQTLIHRIRFCRTVRKPLRPRQRFGV